MRWVGVWRCGGVGVRRTTARAARASDCVSPAAHACCAWRHRVQRDHPRRAVRNRDVHRDREYRADAQRLAERRPDRFHLLSFSRGSEKKPLFVA